jgi:hypothetical protein
MQFMFPAEFLLVSLAETWLCGLNLMVLILKPTLPVFQMAVVWITSTTPEPSRTCSTLSLTSNTIQGIIS